jgi:hypothetical protein
MNKKSEVDVAVQACSLSNAELLMVVARVLSSENKSVPSVEAYNSVNQLDWASLGALVGQTAGLNPENLVVFMRGLKASLSEWDVSERGLRTTIIQLGV